MPDPLPPTVAIEPAAFLYQDGEGNLTIHPPVGRVSVEIPLYRRDDIAPLHVPLVDQHNNIMGHENRKARELLIERVWTDKDGVVWSRPTAFAYAAVCEARHQWEMTAGDARSILVMLADAKGTLALDAIQELARAYLDKTSRSRNIDTLKEPTE